MTSDQIKQWSVMYHDSLMGAHEGTLEDVFAAATDWLEQSRFFPTVADLVPGVDARVERRRELAAAAAAQQFATPLPAGDGEIDWSTVATADLPPGYNYANDPYWQKGLDMLVGMREGTEAVTTLGRLILDLDQRRQQFQGAAKARLVACPTCQGARYLRGSGPDPLNVKVADPESNVIRCPTCCPGGRYDPAAERQAIQHARRKARA